MAYTASDFKTQMTIERIRIENLTAYVYIKFLTIKQSKETKRYRLWLEDCDSGLIIGADNNVYFIDRFGDVNVERKSYYVDVNRNLTICIRVSLYTGNVIDNRFVRNVRFILKEDINSTTTDPTVWLSDKQQIHSRQIMLPDIVDVRASRYDVDEMDKSHLRVRLKVAYPTSKDEFYYNEYLKAYAYFFDGTNLIKTEEIDAIPQDETEKFEFISKEKYGNRVTKIGIEFRYRSCGVRGYYKEFQTRVIDGFAATIYNNGELLRITSIGYNSPNVGSTHISRHKVIRIHQSIPD